MYAKGIVTVLAVMALIAAPSFADKDKEGSDKKAAKIEAKQKKIDKMADRTIDKLLDTSPAAKTLHDKAYGYAVFSVVKVAVGVTGGGGEGVAQTKGSTPDPVYMKMATGGIGLGLGGQKYRTVFLFETEKAFNYFVDHGWQADAEANAAAGTEGANAAATFSNGVAVFQMTDKGLIANVDVSGTKYWKDDALNGEKKKESTD